ncbi:60S ribosomal protein L6 [Orussus abietinus]|uniref:60S ribosomal protein L6 n=1 Tax=Orussus abietinus TaxID=222816 RepID=UPI0006260CFD|nr:60S ribosomal protein L6 [Orussus abietinus]XP_012287115.1 60S ribosomal protein L6 [Orussus abietinus]XP_012287116.1 60S ribosomal protein L6 [Orussus abietinus]
MASTKAQEKEKEKEKAPETGAATPKLKKIRPRNYDLGNGVYRFSRTRMFHKKAIYKFLGKQTPKTPKPKKPVSVEKQIRGEKNGGKRIVLLKKRRANYPTADPVTVHHAKKCFRDHRRYLRSSLKPGTICILLAGQHKGKRVVFLKQLKSGLLLVTGPFLINACPLRRVSQNYVIATSTKIDLTGFKLPEQINDDYFKRKRDKRAKKEEGDIFAKKKEEYKPSDERKADQKTVDKLVIAAIKKHPDKKLLFTYLSAMFGLRSSQYPHRLKF